MYKPETKTSGVKRALLAIPFVVLGGIFALLGYYQYMAIPRYVPGKEAGFIPEVGMQKFSGRIVAPDFTLPDVDGRPVSLSQFRGNYLLLTFRTTW